MCTGGGGINFEIGMSNQEENNVTWTDAAAAFSLGLCAYTNKHYITRTESNPPTHPPTRQYPLVPDCDVTVFARRHSLLPLTQLCLCVRKRARVYVCARESDTHRERNRGQGVRETETDRIQLPFFLDFEVTVGALNSVACVRVSR